MNTPRSHSTVRIGWRTAAFLLVSFIGCYSSTIRGATYYVDSSAQAACSDRASNGSEANPWCTIHYAVGRISPGDTILVKSGTYNEAALNVPASISGRGGSNTVIKAYPGHVVLLNGGGVGTGRFIELTGSNLVFDGFVVTNFNQGIFVDTGTNITVQNCTVKNIGQEGIHVHYNSYNVLVQSNLVYDTGMWQYDGEGIYVGSGCSVALDNTAYVTVRGNTIHDTHESNFSGGLEAIEIKPGTHDCIVENNVVYNAPTPSSYGAIEINESICGTQSWPSNPNHIIRNNRIYGTGTAIRSGTGCLVYNNVIYSIASGSYGVLVDNIAGDNYTRYIYHNTFHAPSAIAVRVSAGTAIVKNNIGPSSVNNLAVNPSYFVNAAGRDYHLAGGSAPIDAGVDLSSIVSVDLDGKTRPIGPLPDIGAYEYTPISPGPPAPPTNLHVQ
jgi:parallel beta-helix repeat protein